MLPTKQDPNPCYELACRFRELLGKFLRSGADYPNNQSFFSLIEPLPLYLRDPIWRDFQNLCEEWRYLQSHYVKNSNTTIHRRTVRLLEALASAEGKFSRLWDAGLYRNWAREEEGRSVPE
jgi:hypothetical protein